MDVLCPACSRQLSIPQNAPGMTLKCPFCGNLFQLGPMPPPSVAYPSGPAMPRGGTAAAGTPSVALEEPIVSDVPRIRRRKKSSPVALALGLLAVLGLV